MPYSFAGQLPAPVALGSGTATVGISSPPLPFIADAPDTPGRVIRGMVNITPGATGGTYTMKLVYGTGTGGTQVGATTSFAAVASAPISVPFQYVDSGIGPSPVAGELAAGGQYSLVITAVGSAGTLNDGGIEVLVPEAA